MATSKHGTLTGSSTVDTITDFTSLDPAATWMLVSLPQGAGDAYFTYATGGNTAATPTVAGAGTIHLSPARPEWPIELGNTTAVNIKLISTAALPYSIHLF